MILAAFFNLICGWLRYLSSSKACFTRLASPQLLTSAVRFVNAASNAGPIANGYWLVLVGQFFGGVAQPFIMNSPAKLASEWFAVSQRDVATTIGRCCVAAASCSFALPMDFAFDALTRYV
jgi:FLVCR family MFS transporter 7